MNIRKATAKDNEACLNIAKGLPEWFNEKGVVEIAKDLKNLTTYIADDGDMLAFVCLDRKSAKVIEIKHIAVKRNSQGHGIGTTIIGYIETEVAPGKIIEVKTLDESSEYEPYVKTRAFYNKNGFIKIEVVDPYPGWDKGNPCAIYVKYPSR